MVADARRHLTRRRLIHFGLLASAAALLARRAAAQGRAPTPSCDDAAPTRRAVEGPFYLPRSPRRASLIEPGLDGKRVILEGAVMTTACRPVAGAVVDLWHADADGEYDLAGYRLRGHQFTDEAGRYRFETVLPGNYGPRTRHFHVKVAAPPGSQVLTTQLYFPGESRNDSDPLFDAALLVAMAEDRAHFDFVLA